MTDDEVLARAKEIERRRAEADHAKRDAVEARVLGAWDNPKGSTPFTLDELCFAAAARCKCGHGLAYPKDCSFHGAWSCSGVLLGTADKGVPHEYLPFAFYSVKSEGQPSAYGATTRPQT